MQQLQLNEIRQVNGGNEWLAHLEIFGITALSAGAAYFAEQALRGKLRDITFRDFMIASMASGFGFGSFNHLLTTAIQSYKNERKNKGVTE